MSHFPKELKYTKSHEWVRLQGDTATIGITDHAQSQLGDLVFVELPKLNASAKTGKELAVVESVKTAADVYSPVDGTIIEVNDALSATPEKINQDAYGEGWLCKIKITHPDQISELLSADDYQNEVGE